MSPDPIHPPDERRPAPGLSGAADRALAQRAAKGQPEAVERLVRRMECLPKLLAVQNNRMGRPLDEHELADLVQDTLVVVWSKLGTFEGRGSLEAWIYRISRFQLLTAVKRRVRRPRLLEELQSPVPAKEAPPGREPEETLALYEALDSLRPEEAEVLRGKHMDQMSFEAIASRLQMSPNTAKTRYYRGLRKLAERLRRTGAEDPA